MLKAKAVQFIGVKVSSIISIASQKGGVGKTATTLNLGVSLASEGHKVLLIDGDPQGSLALSVDMKEKSKAGLYQAILKDADLEGIVVKAKKLPLSMVHLGIDKPSDIYGLTYNAGERRLGVLIRVVKTLAEDYDFTIIDTANNVGSLNAILLSISDSVIIPITSKSNAVRTLPLLLKLLQRIKQRLNPNIALLGLVLQMLDPANPYEMQVLSILRETFPAGTFFSTYIPRSTLFEKAEANVTPVAFLSGAEKLQQAYDNLAQEAMKRLECRKKGYQDDEQPEKLF